MAQINILSVNPEYLIKYGSSIKGITEKSACLLAEILSTTKNRSLKQVLGKAGIPSRYNSSIASIFYINKDCICFNKININDIDPFEIGEIFSAFDGVSKVKANSIEKNLSSTPTLKGEKKLWNYLQKNNFSKDNLLKLKPWITCNKNSKNSFRLNEYASFDNDEIIITEVYPNLLKVGDELKIKGNGFGPYKEWINVKIGGHTAEIKSYNIQKSEITILIPQDAKDEAFLELDINGIPNIQPYHIQIQPSIITYKCINDATLKIEVLGTMHPCLIDIDRESEIISNKNITLETNYYCGTNSCLLTLGGSPGKFFNDTISLNSVISPMYYGAPEFSLLTLPFFAFVYVQLVGEKAKDPITNKETVIYYFFRNGKWWRVIDKNKKHPKDNKAIDLREGANPNFKEVDAKKAAEFNKQFFPTGWEKAWEGFDKQTAIQLQMMAGMLLAMQGISEDDAKLIMQIKQMRIAGRSWDDILDVKWWAILKILLFATATAGAGKLLGRFFSKLFRSKLLKKLTKVDELEDEITITIKKKFQPDSIKKGIQGEIKGTVDKGRGILDCDPVAVDWINKTGKKGLATELFQSWIEKLIEFARKKGLKKVRIRRAARSKSGEKMMERLGFKKIFSGESGSVWEKIIDVK